MFPEAATVKWCIDIDDKAAIFVDNALVLNAAVTASCSEEKTVRKDQLVDVKIVGLQAQGGVKCEFTYQTKDGDTWTTHHPVAIQKDALREHYTR